MNDRTREEAASETEISVYDTMRNEKAKRHRKELVMHVVFTVFPSVVAQENYNHIRHSFYTYLYITDEKNMQPIFHARFVTICFSMVLISPRKTKCLSSIRQSNHQLYPT